MIDLLFELIRKTSAPMPEAEPYGAFHLCFFIIGVPAAAVTAVLLCRIRIRKGTDNTGAFDKVTFSAGLILMLGEIFKQLFYPAVEGAWRAEFFPFQLCSIPMYVAVAVPFIKNERISRAAYTFLATYGLMGGAASYISPGTMLRPYFAITLHSFLWHLFLIFLGVYAAVGDKASRTIRGFSDTAIFYLLLSAAALSVNIAFHPTHPEVNMFYLGPTPSSLPVCRDITARFGWQVNSVLYISALTLCAFLIHLLWHAILYCRTPKERNTKI